ncbi:MAG: NB-ARC domain-containing protein [Ktedonobacteraceae bacterium]
MRQEIGMLPNEQLRHERQRRGWSREYVAEQIGVADPKTIGRWERGVAFPSSHYLQRLCTLFGMLAQDLGLLPTEHTSMFQSVPAQRQSHKSGACFMLASSVVDSTIPPPLVETDGLVGRDKLSQQLKHAFCPGRRPALAALTGLPGVGKTALVRELLSDSDIQRHFADGMLWVSLGLKPDVPDLLGRWAGLLGISSTEMAYLQQEEDLAGAIRAVIGARRMLLVLDDAWRDEEALAFKVGGPNCAYLLTTRIPAVALHFANGGTISVLELGEMEGLELLERFVPDIVSSEPGTARALVQSVGGLPLALTVMGKYLQSQTYSCQPRRLQAALKRLCHTEERLQLTMHLAPLEYSANLPKHAPLSLQGVIETSVLPLDEEARHVLASLSVFPAKPHSFSEEAALAVCDAPVESLDALIDVGLLESAGAGRYTLHQTIASYASTRQLDSAPYERMVEYFVEYVERYAHDFDALEREANNVLAALQAAFERGMRSLLIRGSIPFAAFLEARGWYELAESNLKRAEQAAQSQRPSQGGPLPVVQDDLASLARVLYYQEDRGSGLSLPAFETGVPRGSGF